MGLGGYATLGGLLWTFTYKRSKPTPRLPVTAELEDDALGELEEKVLVWGGSAGFQGSRANPISFGTARNNFFGMSIE